MLKEHSVTYYFPITSDAGTRDEMLSVFLRWVEENVPKDNPTTAVHYLEDSALLFSWFTGYKE